MGKMGKKNNLMSNLYLIGMVLIVVGFFLPMFNGLGQTPNGFKFINLKRSTFVTIGALMIFAGAMAGLVLNFLKAKNSDKLKLIALVVSVVGGIVLVIGFNDNGIYKAIGKGLVKHATIGFYCIIVGWLAAIVGYFKA